MVRSTGSAALARAFGALRISGAGAGTSSASVLASTVGESAEKCSAATLVTGGGSFARTGSICNATLGDDSLSLVTSGTSTEAVSRSIDETKVSSATGSTSVGSSADRSLLLMSSGSSADSLSMSDKTEASGSIAPDESSLTWISDSTMTADSSAAINAVSVLPLCGKGRNRLNAHYTAGMRRSNDISLESTGSCPRDTRLEAIADSSAMWKTAPGVTPVSM